MNFIYGLFIIFNNILNIFYKFTQYIIIKISYFDINLYIYIFLYVKNLKFNLYLYLIYIQII
jgi:hypothetical protein